MALACWTGVSLVLPMVVANFYVLRRKAESGEAERERRRKKGCVGDGSKVQKKRVPLQLARSFASL